MSSTHWLACIPPTEWESIPSPQCGPSLVVYRVVAPMRIIVVVVDEDDDDDDDDVAGC